MQVQQLLRLENDYYKCSLTCTPQLIGTIKNFPNHKTHPTHTNMHHILPPPPCFGSSTCLHTRTHVQELPRNRQERTFTPSRRRHSRWHREKTNLAAQNTEQPKLRGRRRRCRRSARPSRRSNSKSLRGTYFDAALTRRNLLPRLEASRCSIHC